MKQTYAPLSEVPTGESTLADVVPEFMDPSRISLNLGHLSNIATWGGFYANPEICVTDGPTSRQSGGFVERSGGFKSATLTTVEPAVDWEFTSQERTGFRERTPLKLTVNRAELTQRVQQQPGGALRNPDVWARELHNGFVDAITGAAKWHLTGNPLPKDERFVSVLIGLGTGALNTLFIAEGAYPTSPLVSAVLINSLLLPITVNATRAQDLKSRANRRLADGSYSLFPVWQYDRLAVVHGLTRIRRIARANPRP